MEMEGQWDLRVKVTSGRRDGIKGYLRATDFVFLNSFAQKTFTSNLWENSKVANIFLFSLYPH